MKEKLLFIAHTVPLFDSNSADLRIYSILSILSKSYDIVYLAKYPASSESIKNDMYVSRLSDLGIIVYVGNHSIRHILKSNNFKAAFLEYYHVAEGYLQKIKYLQPSCPVIVDSLDVCYLRFFRKYKITKNRQDLKLAEDIKKVELDIYAQADITLTVTEEDARVLQKDNKNITVRILPNVHSLVQSESDRNKNEIIFVGSFGHDPNVDAVLYFCKDILPRIRKVIPEVKFTIVGGNPPPQVRALSNDFITVTGHVPSTTPYLQKSCVSVAPLRYGAGMKGKIGEAMAHGLPVVTTSIGAEGMGLIDRENVIIADTPETLSNAVIELMLNDGLYKNIQNNAIDHIKNNYTTDKIVVIVEDILKEVDGLHVKKLSIVNKYKMFANYVLHNMKRNLKDLYYRKIQILFRTSSPS